MGWWITALFIEMLIITIYFGFSKLFAGVQVDPLLARNCIGHHLGGFLDPADQFSGRLGFGESPPAEDSAGSPIQIVPIKQHGDGTIGMITDFQPVGFLLTHVRFNSLWG